MANHVYAFDMGRYHFPHLHDRHIPVKQSFRPRNTPFASDRSHSVMDLVHRQMLQAAKQICKLEFSI